MIQPINFCVPTVLTEHKCFAIPNTKIIALDIGYSGVKCFTDKLHACFPSLARKVDASNFIGEPNPDDILYRDESDTWVVGARALRDISLQDTNDSERTLYSRHRYDSEMFKIIYRVGMGLCLMGEKEISSGGGRPIFLQTGLPPAYMKADQRDLVNALSGIHLFSLKFGRKQWREFAFELKPSGIGILSQPMGALFSASFSDECKPFPEAKDYINSGTLGLDPGFGTVDTFVIRGGTVQSYDSFDNLGMKMVYKLLSEKILNAHGVHIPIHAIPKILIDGYVPVLNKKLKQTENIYIADMLEQCNNAVCDEAIEKINATYNYLMDFKYLLITGGTSEAWGDRLIEHFSGIKHLQVIFGNKANPALSQVFSNVRGYYFRRVGLMKEKP